MTKKKQFDKNDLIMTLLKGRTFIVLIILVVLFAILNKNFLAVDTLMMMAKHVALYGILAIGMTYVIITGGIDLSVGSVVGLAGMTMCGVSEFWQKVIKGGVIILAVVIDQYQRNLQAKMALRVKNEAK